MDRARGRVAYGLHVDCARDASDRMRAAHGFGGMHMIRAWRSSCAVRAVRGLHADGVRAAACDNGGVTILRTLRDRMRRDDPNAFHTPLTLLAPADAPAIRLRTMTAADEDEWDQVRIRNAAWLEPWDSNDPERHRSVTFPQWIHMQRRDERSGSAIVFVIEYDGRIVGQISLGAVMFGAMRSGIIGYWIDQDYAGRGFTPLAVTMLADWAMLDPDGPRLHRVEIDLVPQNERSRRVVQKIGAKYEGIRRKYMYINGHWRDHESYSLLAEDAPDGFTRRLIGDTPGERVSSLS